MSEKIKFMRKIGENLNILPEDVQRIRRVNGAVTDLTLISGEEVRVKGSYSKTLEKLNIELKPEGIGNYSGGPSKGRLLKHFDN